MWASLRLKPEPSPTIWPLERSGGFSAPEVRIVKLLFVRRVEIIYISYDFLLDLDDVALTTGFLSDIFGYLKYAANYNTLRSRALARVSILRVSRANDSTFFYLDFASGFNEILV